MQQKHYVRYLIRSAKTNSDGGHFPFAILPQQHKVDESVLVFSTIVGCCCGWDSKIFTILSKVSQTEKARLLSEQQVTTCKLNSIGGASKRRKLTNNSHFDEKYQPSSQFAENAF